MKRTCLQVLVVRLLLVARREVLGASLPVFPSLLPPSTTLVGPAEEPTPQLVGTVTVFTQKNNTEHRSQVGTTAVLHCIAHNVGENTVSWVRKRDYHLLTVGSHTYSSDNRFQVRYIKHENDWQLHIRYVQVRDDGVYECQVSSHPPVSLLSTLHVLEATSEILGGPEKYMTVGSSLRLVCVLRDNTQPPSYVFWYHDNHMINYHATREVRVDNKGGLSVLFLSNVRPADSGNYTCAPSNAQPAHISIHVLQGDETPAAIHAGASERSTSSLLLRLVLSLLLCLASTYVSRVSSTTSSCYRDTPSGVCDGVLTPAAADPARRGGVESSPGVCAAHQTQYHPRPLASEPRPQRWTPEPLSCPHQHDLRTYIKEHNVSSLPEAVTLADNWSPAHGAYPKSSSNTEKGVKE